MKATLVNNRIALEFSFDLGLITYIKDNLPDRVWNSKTHPKVWSVPSSPYHCAKIIEVLKPLGFFIDPKIVKCADPNTPKPNLRKQVPTNLYEYQKDGVEFIYAAKGRAIVGDAPGVGKSAQALVFANMFGGSKILIVSPQNVIWKWATKEADLWANGRTVQVIETGKQIITDADIIVMSYGIMVSRYEELMALPFDTMIFDEAHYLKSNKSQRNKVARKITKGVPHILLLTGTAFKNKRFEMFQLLHILDPNQWSSALEFGKRYCGGEFGQGHWITPPIGETNTEELQRRLSPILLRRTKKQIGDQIPELTRVTVPMYLDNAADYDKALEDARREARREGYKPAFALSLLNKLRQIVGRGKVQQAIELAEDILEAGEKVVLFAHHKEIVAQLKSHFWKAGIGTGVIDGSTPAKERQRLAETFLENSGLEVMIISSAGREGIDLYSANQLIFVERLWTPADEEQIEARLQRDGQKNPVTAAYLVAKGTIDERLDEIVRGKRAEFANLIESDIVKEVWLSLLEGE